MPPMRVRGPGGFVVKLSELGCRQTTCGNGDRVLLAPATSYTDEAFKIKVMEGRKMAAPDPKAIKFEKHTKTDDEGRFCFTNLPAGEYYVVADIVLPTSTKEHRESQLAHAKATVKADENVYVLVTR